MIRKPPTSPAGFSLLEVSIALVIIGLLLAVGVLSWSSVVETRRLAKARTQLLEMRDCLLRRSLTHEHYPSDEDVALCRTQIGSDPWGGQIRLVRGVLGDNTTALDEDAPAVTDAARNQTMVLPSPTRKVLTPDGNRTSVALALVSLGKNGAPDHGSASALTSNLSAILTADMDFANPADDLVVVVQGYEVAGYIRNVAGAQ